MSWQKMPVKNSFQITNPEDIESKLCLFSYFAIKLWWDLHLISYLCVWCYLQICGREGERGGGNAYQLAVMSCLIQCLQHDCLIMRRSACILAFPLFPSVNKPVFYLHFACLGIIPIMENYRRIAVPAF